MSPQTVLTWGALDPAHSFIMTIERPDLCAIETPAGRVGLGWRVLVDQRTETTAQPGAMVAAMSREGLLLVGVLLTGVARVPIAADGMRGTVVEYHPPLCTTGWIVPETPA